MTTPIRYFPENERHGIAVARLMRVTEGKGVKKGLGYWAAVDYLNRPKVPLTQKVEKSKVKAE